MQFFDLPLVKEFILNRYIIYLFMCLYNGYHQSSSSRQTLHSDKEIQQMEGDQLVQPPCVRKGALIYKSHPKRAF